MAALQVDEAVGRLVDGLEAVGEAVADAAARVGAPPHEVGPPVLQRAVERFDDAWRRSLRGLADEAAQAAAQVRAAERCYRATDAGVAAACP